LGWRANTQVFDQQQYSFKEFISTKDDIGWVTEVQQCRANFQDLTNAIERSELIGISNGSFNDNMGTAAWRLFDINMEEQQWTGQMMYRGNYLNSRYSDQNW
jgi:hypothetical protein